MNYNDVVTFFKTLTDDEPDAEAIEVLADVAYTKRNEDRVWAMLMKLDTSITHSPGNTWATEKSLPTDFSTMYKLYGGDSDNEYLPVPFESILKAKSQANRYTIDIANNKLRLTGSPSSALTMYMWYQFFPTSLIGLSTAQKASETTIVWPTRFRPILAYDMAFAYFGGVDADDITRKMTPFHEKAYHDLERAMVRWNNRTLLRLLDTSASGMRSSGSAADVIDMT